jgi:hypothetical protein
VFFEKTTKGPISPRSGGGYLSDTQSSAEKRVKAKK